MAQIPKRVTERLIKEARKFKRILQTAKDRDINESDTVVIITDMLSSLFGYDKYSEITSEFAVRGTYCDLAIQLDDSVKYLIEVKAIGLELKEAHLRQAIGYGSQHGVQWVVLTNGTNWVIHRIKFEMPVSSELLCSFNILELNPRKKDDQDILFLLCKEGISKDVIEDFHKHIKSVNKYIIGAIIQSESGLNNIRREIRKISPGTKVETKEIEEILVNEVLKREVVSGDLPDGAKNKLKKAILKHKAKLDKNKSEINRSL